VLTDRLVLNALAVHFNDIYIMYVKNWLKKTKMDNFWFKKIKIN